MKQLCAANTAGQLNARLVPAFRQSRRGASEAQQQTATTAAQPYCTSLLNGYTTALTTELHSARPSTPGSHAVTAVAAALTAVKSHCEFVTLSQAAVPCPAALHWQQLHRRWHRPSRCRDCA